MGAIKWIGGVLGWSVGGVIGSIMGYAVGSIIDRAFSGETLVGSEFGQGRGAQWNTQNKTTLNRGQRPSTQPGDFGVSLLILSAAVMKSDNQVMKSELDYVKQFFVRQFGEAKASNYILMLRELLKQDYNLRDVCQEIKFYMDHASRLQLMHFMFGLSMSDGNPHQAELNTIHQIAAWLGISAIDEESIKAMFIKNTNSAYKILEIDKEATNEEVRKAYKRLAIKHHPDKVSHLGEDIQKAANEKFKEVNQAFEQIKKERGIK